MSKDSVVAYHVILSGRVQGVGFRYSTRQVAVRLGVCGWVRNTPDGSVELVCEGSKDRIERLLKWLKSGPPGSYVTNIDKRQISAQRAFHSFTVEV
ncbi:MAG: acylphosphatase [Spirochaetales bacterium]|nr:acylphosphatase [Spirochaetales bacterium]